jgi:hypothetical protein
MVARVTIVTIHEARSTSMDKRSMDKRRPEGDGLTGFITVASLLRSELLQVTTGWGDPSSTKDREEE